MSGECAELIESMVDPTIEPSLEVTRLPRLRGMRDMQMLLRKPVESPVESPRWWDASGSASGSAQV